MTSKRQASTSALDLQTEATLMALAAPSDKLTALVQYSAGRISRSAALDALGILDYADLVQALNSVGLPLPILNEVARKEMVRRMLKMVADPSKAAG